ncbi:5-hydroxytryptamine receptor 3A-like [Lissotriton helveticus]
MQRLLPLQEPTHQGIKAEETNAEQLYTAASIVNASRISMLCFFRSTGISQNICSYDTLIANLSLDSDSRPLKGRPVKDWRDPSLISIDIDLEAVLDMDEKLQLLSSLMTFTAIWENEYLTWNPEDFCGISRLHILPELVWTPDIYVSERTEEDQSPPVPYILLHSNGTIYWQRPLRIVTACSLDLYKFPFDIQKCNLTFGPYTYSVEDIIMVQKTNSTQETTTSQRNFAKGEWLLKGIDVFSKNVTNEDGIYSKVIYEITIQRTPVLYIINLIVPACFLVLVDIASMFIPMEGGERLGFKITVVLGFSVLLLILNDFLPNSEIPPILGIFCTVCLIIMIVSIIDSIFISYMLHLSAVRPDVPKWLKIWVLGRLAYIMCISTKKDAVENSTVISNTKKETSDTPSSQETELQDRRHLLKEHQDSPEIKLLKRLLVEILMIRRHLIMSKKEEEAKSEWHLVAFVLDRFILILYLFTVLIIAIIVVVVWVF